MCDAEFIMCQPDNSQCGPTFNDCKFVINLLLLLLYVL